MIKSKYLMQILGPHLGPSNIRSCYQIFTLRIPFVYRNGRTLSSVKRHTSDVLLSHNIIMDDIDSYEECKLGTLYWVVKFALL